ncbi:MAG: FAD-dependent oxidoreductase [Pyrinomonadaceae bacterium]|nr:FAD-dependent oxidoreductase [Pyrinomonadaceae bacterium]
MITPASLRNLLPDEFRVSDSGTNRVTCLVVGAGLAGLVAARELRRRGVGVVVFDKGRGAGGRLATRRIGDAVFDHGAQFFTVREAEFGRHVDEWLRAGVVREWCRGFAHGDGALRADAHPRYCGTSGMAGIAKSLAADLDVRTGVRVESLVAHEGGWGVTTDAGVNWRAASLLLTPPVPQSLALIESGGFTLDAETKAHLARIAYDPCIAVMVIFAGMVTLPAPGAVQIEGGEPVYWIADNNCKGVSPRSSAFTIHAGADFSRAHWEADDELIVATLTRHAEKFLRDTNGQPLENAQVETQQVKRWRYSKPTVTYTERCLAVQTPPLVFAGDAFGGARVEGAALSGLAAAEQLATLLL